MKMMMRLSWGAIFLWTTIAHMWLIPASWCFLVVHQRRSSLLLHHQHHRSFLGRPYLTAYPSSLSASTSSSSSVSSTTTASSSSARCNTPPDEGRTSPQRRPRSSRPRRGRPPDMRDNDTTRRMEAHSTLLAMDETSSSSSLDPSSPSLSSSYSSSFYTKRAHASSSSSSSSTLSILCSLAKKDEGESGAQKAEDYLRQCIQQEIPGWSPPIPAASSGTMSPSSSSRSWSSASFNDSLLLPRGLNSKHFTVVMDAWGKSGRADRAQDMWEWMMTLGVMPSRVTYNVMMQALVRVGQVQEAETWLERMEQHEEQEAPESGGFITALDYNVLLAAYARLGQAEAAERLVQRMQHRCPDVVPVDLDHDNHHLHSSSINDLPNESLPDLASYNFLIEAHSRSGQASAGARAREILQSLWQQYETGKFPFKPDAYTYASVMQAVVRSAQVNQQQHPPYTPDDTRTSQLWEAVMEAEALYRQALDAGTESETNIMEGALLDAYAMGLDQRGAIKAHALLQRMPTSGSAYLINCNKVLNAWKHSAQHHDEAVTQAEALLQQMEEAGVADVVSYTTVMGVLAQRGDLSSAQRAQELFERMQQRYKDGDLKVKPTVLTLNSLIHAWVSCGQVQRAEQVLESMEESFAQGHLDLAPSCVTYSTIMDGWAKSKGIDATTKVEEMFNRMQAMFERGNVAAWPNHISYFTLLTSYTRVKDAVHAQKAEDLLLTMYDEYKMGNLDAKPDVQCFTSVIDCWQKSGSRDAGSKGDRLLDRLLSIYDETKDDAFRPNAMVFTAAITAWARSREFGKCQRARGMLTKMIGLHKAGLCDSPNTHVYTAVINSCAYCEKDELEQREALNIAVTTYKELASTGYCQANAVTISTFLTALRNLLPKGEKRDSAIRTVFKTAAKEGYVDQLVIQRVQSALSADEIRQLFSSAVTNEGEIQIDLLPNEWRRNVDSHGSASSKTRRP